MMPISPNPYTIHSHITEIERFFRSNKTVSAAAVMNRLIVFAKSTETIQNDTFLLIANNIYCSAPMAKLNTIFNLTFCQKKISQGNVSILNAIVMLKENTILQCLNLACQFRKLSLLIWLIFTNFKCGSSIYYYIIMGEGILVTSVQLLMSWGK